MPELLSPILLYVACGLGAVGVLVALPRRTFSPFLIGGLIASTAAGLVLLGLGVGNPDQLPNLHFYIFGVIALGASLRVITHPRPVYAALYFVLTILSSAGLYLLLSAEFMAFALIIVYAGAILITYLFVIMLATEAPSDDDVEALTAYDREAREPVVAVAAGFTLLAALCTMLGSGAMQLRADERLMASGDASLAVMPRRVETVLRNARDEQGEPMLRAGEGLAKDSSTGLWAISPRADGTGRLVVADEAGAGPNRREIAQAAWPAELRLQNVEGVALSLIGAHPGSIEIAGIILLMAMLGAVVLARKKVDLDDDAKRAAMARTLVEHGSATPAAGGPSS